MSQSDDKWDYSYNQDEAIVWEYFYKCIVDSFLRINFILSGKCILDAGCGDGELLKRLFNELREKNNLPDKCCGIDNSADAIKSAKNKLDAHFSITFDLRLGDIIKSFPWPDETFDLILSNVVFHNFEKKELALKEIIRVLKPNGTFIVWDVLKISDEDIADIKDRERGRRRFRLSGTERQINKFLDMIPDTNDKRTIGYAFEKEYVIGLDAFKKILNDNGMCIKNCVFDASPFVHMISAQKESF